MLISDWSSDVCSSDLSSGLSSRAALVLRAGDGARRGAADQGLGQPGRRPRPLHAAQRLPAATAARGRAGAREHRAAQLRGDRVTASSRLGRSEEHTSELQSLMRISYSVFFLKKNNFLFFSFIFFL